MSYKTPQPWVTLEKIQDFVQLEPALVTVGLTLGSWLFFRIVLRHRLSKERKRALKSHFNNLFYHLLLGTFLGACYYGLQQLPYENTITERLSTYIGLGAILSGATVFVKVCRILVFEYLFLSHLRVAFPVLLVNLFTLLLSIVLGGWICAEIFSIRLTPLLATSAIFSLVMGLALQDTLGNLFAGVALQFDKPYEIGDWIEVQTGTQKWVGQVFEISWRATVLISFSDEAITVPNRVMSQAQISNYSTKFRPIIRSQLFRLAFGVDIEKTRQALLKAADETPGIRKSPAPLVLLTETTESWIGFKLIYYLDNFGQQYIIADEIHSRALPALKSCGVELAGNKVTVGNSFGALHRPSSTFE